MIFVKIHEKIMNFTRKNFCIKKLSIKLIRKRKIFMFYAFICIEMREKLEVNRFKRFD